MRYEMTRLSGINRVIVLSPPRLISKFADKLLRDKAGLKKMSRIFVNLQDWADWPYDTRVNELQRSSSSTVVAQ